MIILVVVAVLLVAMLVSCAAHNGDRATFCRRLAQAPSFASLSEVVNQGSDAEAAAKMREGAATFRSLERVAPRSIREDVAALGDSAERIARHLASGADSERTAVTYVASDGRLVALPSFGSVSQARIGIFYDEMQHHHGTPSAMIALSTYARNECGLAGRRIDLGIDGYGSPSELGPDRGNVPQPTTVIAPPQYQSPAPSSTERAPTTRPAESPPGKTPQTSTP